MWCLLVHTFLQYLHNVTMTLQIEGIFGLGYRDMWLHFIVFDFAKTKVDFE
jgi:hypothetical protein